MSPNQRQGGNTSTTAPGTEIVTGGPTGNVTRNPQGRVSYERLDLLAITEGELPGPRWGWLPGGLNESADAVQERSIGFSATILDALIPVTYGERTVTGLFGAVCPDGSLRYCYCGVVFGHGEQASIAEIKVNGEAIADCSWISSYETRLGADTQAVSSIMGGGVSGWVETWPGLCCLFFKLSLREAELPGSLTITAKLGGRKIYDFRDSTTSASTNPVVIAYDMETASDIWKGLPASKLELDSWERVADWCDEVMGDSSKRWTFNGTVTRRETADAIRDVLGHCFAQASPHYNKYVLVAQMPPDAISGTWTASGTSVSGSGGAATTELEAGDIVYVDTYPRIVDSVTNDDLFTVTVSVTVTSKTVRKTSGIYLTESDYAGLPQGSDIPASSIPDRILVKYINGETGKPDMHPCEPDSALDTARYRQTEVTFDGCNNASMAERCGQLTRRLRAYQPFFWSGTYQAEQAAQLVPGDICFCDFSDGFVFQPVRVLEKTEYPDGTFELEFQEYDPSAISDDTAADDTPPSINPGIDTSDPDAPTALDQKFLYSGNFDGYNLLADDDDLTGSGAQFSSTNCILSLDGSGDFSTISYSGSLNGSINKIIDGVTFPGGSASDRVLVAVLFRQAGTYNAGFEAELEYNGTPGGATTVNLIPGGVENSNWQLKVMIFEQDAATIDLYFKVAWNVLTTAKIDIRKLFVIPWGSNPNLNISMRYSFTEHASAADTVSVYQALMEMQNDQDVVVASVPQGNDQLEFVVVSGGGFVAPPIRVSGQHFFRTLGPNGYVDSDPDTQSVQELGSYGIMNSIYDMDETNMAAGTVVATASDGVTKEHQTVTALSLVDVETITAASDTLDAENHTVLCDCTSNSITINLPAAASHTGRTYFITKIDSSAAYLVTIDPNASETISGSSTRVLTYQWDTLKIISDGSNWIAQ